MNKQTELNTALQRLTRISMQNSMRGFMTMSKKLNLSMSQIGAMMHINRCRSCGVSNIGEELGITNAASSQLLERLVQSGYIIRVENPDDRRAKKIELTEKGTKLIKQGNRIRYDWISGLTESFSEDELDAVLNGVNILIRKSNEMEYAE